MAIIDTLRLARALRDKGDIKFLQWQIGINTALLIAILVKLFVH